MNWKCLSAGRLRNCTARRRHLHAFNTSVRYGPAMAACKSDCVDSGPLLQQTRVFLLDLLIAHALQA